MIAGCKQSNSDSWYTISCTDSSLVDGAYVYLDDGITWEHLASAQIKDHSFSIKSNKMGSEVAYIFMGDEEDDENKEQMTFQFILEPGNITLFRKNKDGVPSEFLYGSGTPLNDKMNSGQLEFTKETVRENHNILGFIVLSNMFVSSSKSEIEQLMSEFPDEMKKHPYYKELEETLNKIKADVGLDYLDIEGNDVNGDPISLSEVVQKAGTKYVLLDFWASWCEPCREAIPELINIYNKYKDSGFEIFGYSFDAKVESWQEALKTEEMPWPNVIPAKIVAQRRNPVWTEYGLDGIPWSFLIDASSGKIIAKNLSGEELSEKLAELLS